MDWIKINGCDFNVKVVAALSFEEFKKEFEHSFCITRSEDELKKVHEQIIAIYKPKEDGNNTTDQAEVAKPTRKGSRTSSTGNSGE